MKYNSTRDKSVSVTASQAILKGISNEGGLFVPDSFPDVTLAQIEELCAMSYVGRAERIISLFLDGFTAAQCRSAAEAAYIGTFENDSPAPVVKLPGGRYVMELFRGPTCAFKDMALRLLPQLMSRAAENEGKKGETVILVATSGDTGKAALEGFRDADGVRIIVFYPVDGVSAMQKLQMKTQEGGNVGVAAVRGNFDNTQSGVKSIFTDEGIKAALEEKGMSFSSANSINWGRLLPQIVYYFSAYADLVKQKEIAPGDKVNFAVPTGNFGNILAAYYAKIMGLPVGKLICASNKNRVLSDFIETGSYDIGREFYATISPSMDILISSNLERLLYHLLGNDDNALKELMESLKREGKYSVSGDVITCVKELFYGGSCDDTRTREVIKRVYDSEGYLLDTHTAVAMAVTDDYISSTGDNTKTVVVSTASPYKFAGSVYTALTGKTEQDEFTAVSLLSELTGVPVPKPLSELKQKAVRFEQVIGKDEMPAAVIDFISEKRY